MKDLLLWLGALGGLYAIVVGSIQLKRWYGVPISTWLTEPRRGRRELRMQVLSKEMALVDDVHRFRTTTIAGMIFWAFFALVMPLLALMMAVVPANQGHLMDDVTISILVFALLNSAWGAINVFRAHFIILDPAHYRAKLANRLMKLQDSLKIEGDGDQGSSRDVHLTSKQST